MQKRIVMMGLALSIGLSGIVQADTQEPEILTKIKQNPAYYAKLIYNNSSLRRPFEFDLYRYKFTKYLQIIQESAKKKGSNSAKKSQQISLTMAPEIQKPISYLGECMDISRPDCVRDIQDLVTLLKHHYLVEAAGGDPVKISTNMHGIAAKASLLFDNCHERGQHGWGISDWWQNSGMSTASADVKELQEQLIENKLMTQVVYIKELRTCYRTFIN